MSEPARHPGVEKGQPVVADQSAPAAGHWTVLAAAAVTAALDQATKVLARQFLAHRPGVPVVRGVLDLRYIENRGAVFGLLQEWPLLVTALAVLALLLVGLALLVHPPRSRALRAVLGCGVGGAVGNLFDRLAYGHVVDFIDLGRWPAFNVADTAIVVALVPALMSLFWGREMAGEKEETPCTPPCSP